MNIHTSHVMTIHTLSTIRHYSFPLAVNPVNCCYVVCYIHSLLCFVDLNFFPVSFGYSAFTGLPLSQLFLLCLYSDSFSLCLFLHVQVTLPSISLVVIIVSAQNGSMSCQTHALHCMLISHGLHYMVMSKGLHVTDVDVFHTCNWAVCCMYWTGVSGVGSTGVVGANATIRLSEAPMRLHYTCPIYHSLYSNWEGFKDSSISADSGHERVGMMGGGGGGGGAQMSCPHQGALVYILVLKLRV